MKDTMVHSVGYFRVVCAALLVSSSSAFVVVHPSSLQCRNSHHHHNHHQVPSSKPCYLTSVLPQRGRTLPTPPLFSSINDDNDKNMEFDDERKRSGMRAGGRSPRRNKPNMEQPTKNNNNANNPLLGFAKRFVVPILGVWLLLKLFFGSFFDSTNSSSSYVYYSSSVYESTTYNAQGTLERIRKENVKSNVPGLVEQFSQQPQQQQRNNNNNDDDDYYNDFSSPSIWRLGDRYMDQEFRRNMIEMEQLLDELR